MADYIARKAKIGFWHKLDFGSTGDIGEGTTTTANYTLLMEPEKIAGNKPTVSREEYQLTSAQGLIAERARSFTDAQSSLHHVKLGGVAIREQLPLLFFLALLKAAETDYTVPNPDNYQQVFTFFAKDSLPDFTNPYEPEGNSNPNVSPPLAIIAIDETGTTGSELVDVYSDCIVDTLDFSVNPNAQGTARFAQVDCTFAAGYHDGYPTSGDFTFPTPPAVVPYNNQNAFAFSITDAITYSGCFKEFRLTINNNVTSDCKTTGGRPTNLRVSPEAQIEFSLPYNSTTQALKNKFVEGTEATIKLSTGTTGQLGFLEIEGKGALINLETAIENNVWVLKGTLKCEQPASGEALKVTMCSLTQLIGVA
ncbi:MAG: hypothetical protein H3C48_00720 [Chitinophagaceae bacterium]|nr:hypothetical protein [Chitinophagaceae bacterium]